LTPLLFSNIIGVVIGKTVVFEGKTLEAKQGGLYVHIRGYSGSRYGGRTGDYR